MHVLIIGGTRFVGALLTWRLIHAGHRVTLLNRGTRADPFGDRVERLVADRTSEDLAQVLGDRRFDAAVDLAAYTGADARGAVAALDHGRVGHYVLISTGQVYLVRDPRPAIAREDDYDGPVMAEPASESDQREWRYGVGKREIEDHLAAAWARQGFPATRVRLPMINGERDYYRRLESYLWRLMDGGPIIVPDGGVAPTRHVYGGDVARALADMLGQESTFGKAYNLAQEETPTLVDILGLLAEMLGVTSARSARALGLVSVPARELHEAGLDPVAVSPFSGRWMSLLDPARARDELGFWHRPLAAYLEAIVAGFLAHTPAQPPPGYAHRARELALAARR